MKFDSPAQHNPIDRLKMIGKATERIDGALKTTGRATYAYEQNDAAPNAANGVILGAAVARAASFLVDVRYAPGAGKFDLAKAKDDAPAASRNQRHRRACSMQGRIA